MLRDICCIALYLYWLPFKLYECTVFVLQNGPKMDQFWMDLNGGFVWGLKSFFEGFWEYFEELEELYCQGLHCQEKHLDDY